MDQEEMVKYLNWYGKPSQAGKLFGITRQGISNWILGNTPIPKALQLLMNRYNPEELEELFESFEYLRNEVWDSETLAKKVIRGNFKSKKKLAEILGVTPVAIGVRPNVKFINKVFIEEKVLYELERKTEES
jgi:hypothetical protein